MAMMKRLLNGLPWVVLALSLAMTLFFWNLYDRGLREHAEAVYLDRSAEVISRIIQRLRDDEQVLRGGAGLFNVSDAVSRDDWRRYFATLKLGEHYPGIQGMGFAQWLAPGEKDEHIRQVRAEGFPEYSVQPVGERPVYTAIVYLEPFDWRNQRAFGYDMFSEPVRRAAMERARDTGETAIAAPVALVQETDQDPQSGLLMYVPIYQPDLPTGTVEERRRAILGFSYSPIRINDFVHGALGQMPSDLAFDLLVAGDGGTETRMFDSLQAQGITLPPEYTPILRSRIPADAYGLDWRFDFQTLPLFAAEMNLGSSRPILAGGVTMSLLLALIAFILQAAQRRAAASARAIAASERRFRNLFNYAPIGLFHSLPEGRFLLANPALAAMLGYASPQELVAGVTNIGSQLFCDPAQRPRILAAILHQDDWFKDEILVRRQDGQILIADLAGRRVLNDAGEIAYLEGFIVDITERKRTEKELDRARNAAEAANHAKSAFLASMSHEIRTPLNAILGSAQVLGRDPALNVTQRDSLAAIRRGGEHLLTLINDILSLAKIEAGRLTLQVAPFDLRQLLADLEALFRPRIRERGLTLRIEAEGIPGRVVGDQTHLRQVLLNLVGNAIKFTPAGGIRVQVALAKERPDGEGLRFLVADTGVGIGADELPRLFKPFSQTASGRQAREGTGLGLVLSREYVALMGGDLSVESVPGQGSCFAFTLPLPPAALGELAAPAAPTPVLGLEPGQPVCRVLIVDDLADNRVPLRALLETLNPQPPVLELREAADGQEAVNLWEDWQPRLIFMDMRMPLLSGQEATRQIRSRQAARPGAVPSVIVALTASAFEEQRERVLASGCDAFARKPFQAEELFGLMERLVGLRFLRTSDPTPRPSLSRDELIGRYCATPEQWRSKLRKAVALGDFGRINSLLDALRDTDPALGEVLGQWAYNFDLEAFAALFGADGAGDF
jgi:PAS domain S-box-containing protein